ncbi:MAG TPA: hypothetical protein VGU25_15340 [Acidobacteriaceae bacterium]|nr:hypothetical protein [Acidobacteriaceae bacterium]
MKRPVPPASLQHVLLALLPPRDHESVTGDLLEAYVERRSRDGALRANAWFALQTASFAPRAAMRAYGKTPGLVGLCCFTAACGCWLGTMSILLRHGNLLQQEAIAGLIVGQALLTLVMLPLRRIAWLRWAAALGAVAIMWRGGSALISMLRGDHSWEGYILIIASLLMIQAALTWRALLRSQPASA